MSYVWLPVDVNLFQNHKTARLSRSLGCPRAHAIGYLVCLWSWASVHAPDGNLQHLDAEDIGTAAEWEGDLDVFAPALIKAGFMDEDHTLHDWEEHQGASFRKRLSEAEKKRLQRDKKGTPEGQEGDTEGTESDDRTGQDRTGHKEEEERDGLVRLAVAEIPASESTPEDYRRTIDRYRVKLGDAQIERVILNLANWKPKTPRAKLHLTLASWLNKEEPDRATAYYPPDDEIDLDRLAKKTDAAYENFVRNVRAQ